MSSDIIIGDNRSEREQRMGREREWGGGEREREGCQRQERETTRGGGLGGDRYIDRDRDRETERQR